MWRFEQRSRYLKHFDNLVLVGDLKSESRDNSLNDFSNFSNLKSLNKERTCFKNPNNPSCIDFFLANRPLYLQNIFTVETEISDFQKLVVTVLRMFYKKQKPKIIQHRSYKTFKWQLIRIELCKALAKVELSNAKLLDFHDKSLSVFDRHAPVKYK